MSLNWREINLILEELSLVGCHLQKVVQPDFTSLVLDLYRPGDPFSMIISLESGKTRLHRLFREIARPEKSQRFAQLLRSRLRGGRIVEATQIGKDRIVKLKITAGEETLLWLRLWSGAANIIATDSEGRILDAFYRRPSRGEVSGGRFNPEGEAGGSVGDTTSTKERGAGRASGATDPERFRVRDLPGEGSFNERVERLYATGEGHGDVEGLRVRIGRLLERRETAIQATLENLAQKTEEYTAFEQLKHSADLIMSNLHRISPGDSWLSAESLLAPGEHIEVALDPTLAPQKNAELYYERYKKAKAGLASLHQEMAELQGLLDKIAEERTSMASVEDPSALAEFARRLERRQERKEGPRLRRPGLEYHSAGYTFLVGRSAKENDELLRKHVRGNDWWLHSRDYPGAYVFIKAIPGKSIPLDVLLDAANLALYYSKGRSGGHSEMYYTAVKYLRRPREGKLGLVLPTHEKNLSVRLDTKRLERLFGRRDFLSEVVD